MLRVADVLKPEVGCSWHEAVAIVLEAAARLEPGSHLPAPADVVLEEDGTLAPGFPEGFGESGVCGLGRLLRVLLEGSNAPAGLRELAVANAADPPDYTRVADFVSALSFFERPGRASHLAAVARRVRENAANELADQEVERLREQLLAPREQVAEAAPAPPSSARRKGVMLGALAIAELVVLLLLISSYTDSGERSPNSVTGRIEQGLADVVESRLNPPRSSSGLYVAPDPGAAPVLPLEPAPLEEEDRTAVPEDPPASVRRPSRQTLPAARDRRAVSAASNPEGLNRPERPSAAAPSAASSLPDGPSRNPVAQARVAQDVWPEVLYTEADTEVRPPTLIRPQFPKEPALAADAGYLELVVDQVGQVETVRLVSPTRRYHDRMIVAAAKAWKFAPARLNGQPVRFLARIPINVQGPR